MNRKNWKNIGLVGAILLLLGAFAFQGLGDVPISPSGNPDGGLVVGQGYDTARHEWYIQVAPCPADVLETTPGPDDPSFLGACSDPIRVKLTYAEWLTKRLGERYNAP